MHRTFNRVAATILLCGSYSLAYAAPVCPKDIGDFMERYYVCHHFAGEDPYDAERAKDIETQITKFRCDTLESDEVVLRKSYRNDENALRQIHHLEAVWEMYIQGTNTTAFDELKRCTGREI